MVNTISVDHIKHIVYSINDNIETNQRYFTVKIESTLCTVRLYEWNNKYGSREDKNYLSST